MGSCLGEADATQGACNELFPNEHSKIYVIFSHLQTAVLFVATHRKQCGAVIVQPSKQTVSSMSEFLLLLASYLNYHLYSKSSRLLPTTIPVCIIK